MYSRETHAQPVFWLCLVSLHAAALGADTRPATAPIQPIKNSAELLQAAGALMTPEPEPWPPPKGTRPPDHHVPIDESKEPDLRWLWIIDYLGSPQRDLQQTAAYCVANAKHPLRASACERYLSAEYPLDVRMAALCVVLRGHRTATEGRMLAPRLVQQYKVPLADVLAAAGDQPVCPPYLLNALDVNRDWVDRGGGGLAPGIGGLIAAERQATFIRRALACMHAYRGPGAKIALLNMLTGSQATILVEEIRTWYEVEPDPDARAAGVAHIPVDQQAAKQLCSPVWRLAGADWDAHIWYSIPRSFQPKQDPERPEPAGVVYENGETLRAGFAALRGANASADDKLWQALWPYFDSQWLDLQTTAAETLVKSPAVPKADLSPYLAQSYPVAVRVAATIVQMRATPEGQREREKPKWAKVVAAAWDYPVSPPFLRELIEQSPWSLSDPQWVAAKSQPMIIRRALRLLATSTPQQAKSIVLGIRDCDSKILNTELVAWYAVEPDATVRHLLLETLSDTPDRFTKLAPLYELVRKDWNAENVRLSKP